MKVPYIDKYFSICYTEFVAEVAQVLFVPTLSSDMRGANLSCSAAAFIFARKVPVKQSTLQQSNCQSIFIDKLSHSLHLYMLHASSYMGRRR